jgi:hypothetical protein
MRAPHATGCQYLYDTLGLYRVSLYRASSRPIPVGSRGGGGGGIPSTDMREAKSQAPCELHPQGRA